jgi:hypothetical protein
MPIAARTATSGHRLTHKIVGDPSGLVYSTTVGTNGGTGTVFQLAGVGSDKFLTAFGAARR